MPKVIAKLKQVAGFTMIELLIVIAIIGIIAVAMLSALDPLEQINRGNDSRVQADAAELMNGIERYYAGTETWPSELSTTNGITSWVSTGSLPAIAASLAAANEVKAGFGNRLGSGAGKSNVFVRINGDQVQTCFLPKSKQAKNKAATYITCNSVVYGTSLCTGSAATTNVCMP